MKNGHWRTSRYNVLRQVLLIDYSLRKYDIPDIEIGGKSDCNHEWGKVNITLKHKSGETNPGKESWFKDSGTFEDKGNVFCVNCSACKGQYGLEPTYQLYIEHTLLWAKEAWRVLRDDGVFFLNIGDSWNGSGDYNDGGLREGQPKCKGSKSNLPSKCKLLIPHRVAIGLIEQNWILRNDLIWYKPNAMPESVRDRFSKKFEYIFMLTKTGKYYFDLDAVREPNKPESLTRDEAGYKASPMQGRYQVPWEKREGIHDGKKFKDKKDYGGGGTSFQGHSGYLKSDGTSMLNPNGKNPGDVWTINTQPSPERHYAMWPESLVERMILCSTKAGDSILDPFAGSGCTLRVVDKLNREAYGIDLGYQDIQERRLSNIQKELIL